MLPDSSIIYYDFGMMGEIPAFTKDRLMSIFYAVYEKDAKKVRCLQCPVCVAVQRYRSS